MWGVVGIKKGIVEVADVVVVNKSDGDLVPAAQRIQTEYTSALKFVRPKTSQWHPQVDRVCFTSSCNFLMLNQSVLWYIVFSYGRPM